VNSVERPPPSVTVSCRPLDALTFFRSSSAASAFAIAGDRESWRELIAHL